MITAENIMKKLFVTTIVLSLLPLVQAGAEAKKSQNDGKKKARAIKEQRDDLEAVAIAAMEGSKGRGDKLKPSKSWNQISSQFECPQWFRDAKFGIWTHWGAQTVLEKGGGWYGRHMYMEDVGRQKFGEEAFEYHRKTYGHQSEVGYKDVLNRWKAEHFDADALLEYVKSLGARYFVTLANHHDHFDNFNSTYQPWNSMKVGPKRDVVGEFAAATRKVGLRFGVSSHDDRYLEWFKPAFGSDTSGPKKGVPYDGNMTKADGKGKWWEGLDPADLYGRPPSKRTTEWETGVKKNWVLRHRELIEKYDPDMIWVDGHGFPYREYGRYLCELFYERSLKKHGRIEAVFAGKIKGEPATITDFEGGLAGEIVPRPWHSIVTLRDWFCLKADAERPPSRDARVLAESLADVISKNGNLLLNVELRDDGTVSPTAKPVYDDLGKWVTLNAEAIFGTRPWKIHGDNLDLKELKTRWNDHRKCYNYKTNSSPRPKPDEVRFTTKDGALYVFVLNPKAGPIQLPSLGLESKYKPGKVASVQMIGSDSKIDFSQNGKALTLTVPEICPTKYATVFKLGF